MLKKITLTLGLASVIALTGCATNHHTTRNEKLLDVTRVEKFITKDQSTLTDVRELIGTPAYAAKTVQGNDIVGYSFVGERSGASAAGHAIADILTLGIAADDEHKTVQKNIYFLLDDNKWKILLIWTINFVYSDHFLLFYVCTFYCFSGSLKNFYFYLQTLLFLTHFLGIDQHFYLYFFRIIVFERCIYDKLTKLKEVLVIFG